MLYTLIAPGEMLVGPARVFFMDEISTGLGSSTTFQVVKSLRQSIHILGGTAVISLLQPAPETYDLFDDIILLSDGLVVYQGPREHVLEFFEYMGFKCPERKGVADFLQEVTYRKDQQQYWADNDEPYRFITFREFAEAFCSFHVSKGIGNELAVPYDRTKSHPAALTTSRYGVSKRELLKATFARELLLMKRNSFVYAFKAIQLMIVALITMTPFLRTEKRHDLVTGGGVYMGVLFFSLVTIVFNAFSELGMTISKLPVFYKQRDLSFYPSWAYAIPSWILKIPISFVLVAVWVFMTYYVIGFDPDVGRLFKQYLLLFMTNQMASGLLRFIGAAGRSMVVANTFGSFAQLIMLVPAGFILSRESVKKWWIWGYWVSPMMYAQNAISTNEFLGKSWSIILPQTTETLGVSILESRGIFPEAKWYWIGVGALIGYTLLFNFLFTAALTYLNPFGNSQAAMSEDTLKEKQANITGEILEASSRRNKVNSRSATKDEVVKQSSPPSLAVDSKQSKKEMVLPFVPLSITFDNIRYSVDMPQEMKAQGITEEKLDLLKGVSGSFRPGVLTALMGVSGAGKTTLMDVLAGRKTCGHIKGNITINGYPKKQETFVRVSGYCEQNDIHSPHMTVYESLIYSAWLRIPPDAT